MANMSYCRFQNREPMPPKIRATMSQLHRQCPVDEALEALQGLVLFQAESAKVRAVLQRLYNQKDELS